MIIRDHLAEDKSEPVRDRENRILRRAMVHGGVEAAEFAPVPILPVDPDERMRAQRGLFTVDPDLRRIRRVPVAPRMIIVPGEPLRSQNDSLLLRIDLPSGWKQTALNVLRRMGIGDDSMFPGLDGAGRAVRRLMEVDLDLSVNEFIEERFSPKAIRWLNEQETPPLPFDPPVGSD